MRFRFLDILLFALLFIFVNSFPIDLFNLEPIYKELIRMGLRIVLLSYDIYLLWKSRINIFKFANYRRALLFIPFLLACFSNLIAAGVAQQTFHYSGDNSFVVVITINVLLGAILEEFLFRFIIHNSLVGASSIKRIFGGAAIFALFHLLNLVDVSNVNQLYAVLLQVVYTFGLGIMLGFIYEYSYSLPICIGFHFCFNFFNSVLVMNMFGLVIPNNYFIITAVVVAGVIAIYLPLIYFLVLRKNNRYFNE